MRRNYPKPHKDLEGVLGTTFTVNGDENRVVVTINGVRDGDDQENYNFVLTNLNGDSNEKSYEFIVLRPPEPPKLETIRDHAIEGETTDISKCIARGKWLDFTSKSKLIFVTFCSLIARYGAT